VSVAPAVRPRFASSWRAFEDWVGTRASALTLFVVALAVFALESAAIPVFAGRDMGRYVETYVQLGYHVPVLPSVLNTRGPLAALGVGVPLEISGWAAEVMLALLYAASIVAWGRVALVFGARAAALTTVLLVLYPGYTILFHELASDSLFAAAFAGWALLTARAIERPGALAFVLAGLAGGALVLVRPANQVLIVMGLVPLFVPGRWWDRARWAAAFVIAFVAVAQAWRVFATLRYGDTVALKPSKALLALAVILAPLLLPPRWRVRGLAGVAVLLVVGLVLSGRFTQSPVAYARTFEQNESNQFLYRTFELERLFSPDNGPASRRVARTVEQQLLTREPYRSYRVDVHEFFSSGSDRVFGDLTGVVPAGDLAAATREAIRRHPRAFASGVAHTAGALVWSARVRAPVAVEEAPTQPTSQPQKPEYVVINGRRLPRPSEGQPIPASALGPALTTIHGSAREVWRSPTQHDFVFSSPADQRRFEKFQRDVADVGKGIPPHGGNDAVVRRLNDASDLFPPPLVWLAVGVVTLLVRRPRSWLAAVAPAAAGLAVIFATALVAPSVAEYSAPVSPAFVVLAAAGVLGAPSRRLSDRALPRRGITAASIALAGLAAAWGLWHYGARLWDAASGGEAPHDLAVFLYAAGKLVHGHSPYAFRGDSTYAYPPLLGFLAAPFHAMGDSAATVVWMVLSLAAVALALWWLELRDWRCYALAAIFPFTRSAVDLGTVAPLLLLSVAALWRWRDRLAVASGATGAAVALKLYLWPLVVWLAVTRRLRAAVGAAVCTVLLVLLPWAAVGFAGLGRYPGLLRHLSRDEATSSYSVTALAVRAHLPESVGLGLSALVAVALLAGAAWVARHSVLEARERDMVTLTFALAAALAASPIVWIHYFLLLLVPLALFRPRLSPLWFVPLLYYPLGETAWPAGDTKKLGLALLATLIVLGATAGRDAYRAARPA
jgi:Glycosyltransferase family 87